MKWYALQVLTGHEPDVAAMLRRSGLQAIAPTRAALEKRGGAWDVTRRTLLPGYVLLYVDMTVPLYYHLQRKPFAVRLLGGAGEHVGPIPDDQMHVIGQMILHYDNDLQTGISHGQTGADGALTITDGPLALIDPDLIIKTDARRRRATVRLTLYDDPYETDMALVIDDPDAATNSPDTPANGSPGGTETGDQTQKP